MSTVADIMRQINKLSAEEQKRLKSILLSSSASTAGMKEFVAK